jgi:hypothetical protein
MLITVKGVKVMTDLILVAGHGFLDIVQLLVRHGAEVNDEYYLVGETP